MAVVATILHVRCQYCGKGNEVRKRGYVPADFFNDERAARIKAETQVKELCLYVQQAAGPETVLLPTATLALMSEERMHAVMNVMQLDLLRRCHEDRFALKQRVRELETTRGS